MPRPDAERPLLPSVLDRLIDREPRASAEPPGGRPRLLAEVKAAVKRDLEWLLNTKRMPGPPAGMPHLTASLLTYGLPDLTACSLASVQDRERLRRSIEAAIRRFEPRLTGVGVTLVEGEGGELGRDLRFRIDAMLRAEPEPEPVTFDSMLQVNTMAFLVRAD